MAVSRWARWKRVAHRAAEFQANAVFFLLYFVAVVPMRALRLDRDRTAPDTGKEPVWIHREPTTCDLSWARRQF